MSEEIEPYISKKFEII